jgi:glutathione S-transferase
VSFEYVDTREAMRRKGFRMVVSSRIPSPWGEAAKGFLYLKGIPWTAVRLAYDDADLKQWAGQLSAPVAFYDDEPPRSGWAEILMLTERLAPAPALLPLDPDTRARALLLCGKFCAPGGLGWLRRLQNVHAGLAKQGGFSERVAGYLGKKYGYDPAQAEGYGPGVRALLNELAAALRSQRRVGPYYLGTTLSAVDVYSATFMGIFCPLPELHCAMDPSIRAAFEHLDEPTAAALDPVLLEHRDMMYARHLELPLSL